METSTGTIEVTYAYTDYKLKCHNPDCKVIDYAIIYTNMDGTKDYTCSHCGNDIVNHNDDLYFGAKHDA